MLSWIFFFNSFFSGSVMKAASIELLRSCNSSVLLMLNVSLSLMYSSLMLVLETLMLSQLMVNFTPLSMNMR